MREIGMKLVHPPKTMILSNGPVDGADDYDSGEGETFEQCVRAIYCLLFDDVRID